MLKSSGLARLCAVGGLLLAPASAIAFQGAQAAKVNPPPPPRAGTWTITGHGGNVEAGDVSAGTGTFSLNRHRVITSLQVNVTVDQGCGSGPLRLLGHLRVFNAQFRYGRGVYNEWGVGVIAAPAGGGIGVPGGGAAHPYLQPVKAAFKLNASKVKASIEMNFASRHSQSHGNNTGVIFYGGACDFSFVAKRS
jgi:hypothetical protein